MGKTRDLLKNIRDTKEPRLRGRRRARRSYPTLKVRKGGSGEIPLVQGKEQWCTLLEQP